MKTTISALQQHFDGMYGRRNLFVNGSFELRALHLNYRFGRVARAIRKGEPLDEKLARLASYFMSCVNYFRDHLDLELGMMEKFPSTGCLYCGHMPCDCKEDRPDPTQYLVHECQKEWTIREWQEHLKRVYGHFNTDCFSKVFQRMADEIGEFGILLAEGPHTPISSEEMIVACRREAADVFSWILTMAYVLNIDLELAVETRYGTCPGCDRSVNCACNNVFISKDGKHFSRVGTSEFTSHQPPEK
jgi:NTP pyrophosphatase (non-canonical NTP hydrolase)